MKEIWKPVVGYEGLYEVSNLGNVKSLNKRVWNGHVYCVKRGKEMRKTRTKKGYLEIGLCNKRKKVHRLVAQAFIPNPENKPQVNHIDGDKTNNEVSNLEWVTNSENQKHSYRDLSRMPVRHLGETNPSSKLTVEAVSKIRKRYRDEKVTQRVLAEEFGITIATVSLVVNRKIWKEVA